MATDRQLVDRFKESLNIRRVSTSGDQLVIALDFGTTFSGIAYAFNNSAKPNLISIVDWPGALLYSKTDRSS